MITSTLYTASYQKQYMRCLIIIMIDDSKIDNNDENDVDDDDYLE